MKSERRFSPAFQDCPVTLSITSARDSRYIDVNKTFERLTGYTRAETIGRTPSDLGTWVDYPQRVTLVTRLLTDRTMQNVEARFRRRGGQIWTGLSSLELIEIDEEPCVLMVTADITERKLIEGYSKLTQELIHAREGERARVNSELHRRIDELILASIYFDRFRQHPFEFAEVLRELRQLLKDAVNHLLDLSDRLYPAKLEYLGLAAAAAGFCKELSETHQKTIHFHTPNLPAELPNDISLCLYRVLQELLQDAVKYSGAQELEVSITAKANEIHLSVCGWDRLSDTPLESRRGRGFALVKERLKQFGGELSNEWEPLRGTTIHAQVPLKVKGKSTVVT